MLAVWLVIVVATAGVCWLATCLLVERDDRVPLLVLLAGLAAVGATAGLAGGLSRVGAAGEIVSAALGLLGGVVVWLFAADRSKGVIVSISAIAFSLALFNGYFEAAARRSSPESYLFWREKCFAVYTSKDIADNSKLSAVADASFGSLCAQIFTNEKQNILDAKSDQT